MDTSLDDEINNCDCMISYSSTVLEEGLEKKKTCNVLWVTRI